MRLLPICALLLASLPLAAKDLEIYAIDVEGGKATLFVSPSGESMLIDAGYAGFNGRDTDRILAVTRLAGVKQIDYFVVSHYHSDHAGGIPALAARIPIRRFIDHGPFFPEGKKDATFDAYVAVRDESHHTVAKPGDTLPVKGFDVEFVTAAGTAIDQPLKGAGQPNPACPSYKAIEPDPGENAHSLGMIVTYGKFRLADLGDLYWNQEFDLACPTNKLGMVDVYMTTHHGTQTSGAPQIVHALHPRVAIMNNGARKGGSVLALETLHASPGLEDLWQLHFSIAGAALNTNDKLIANPDEKCEGNWIRLTAHKDGSFTVLNGRNRFEKTYRAR